MMDAAALRPRHIQLHAERLPLDAYLVRSLRGRDAISMLPRYELTVVSRGKGEDVPALELEEALHAGVRIVLEGEGGVVLRTIHGQIVELRERGQESASHLVYELTIRPAAWNMSLFQTQELFLRQSMPEILLSKAAREGGAIEARLAESYPERELVLQYQESDLAFVSRLSEHLGISYFVENDADGERLVFTDHLGGMATFDGDAVPFMPGTGMGVYELSTVLAAVPEVHVVQDYNYRIPDVDLTAVQRVDGAHGGGVVACDTHHKTPQEGAALARVRAEEAASRRWRIEGKSAVGALSAGMQVVVEGHPRYDGEPLLITEVELAATQPVGTGGETGELTYENRFSAVRTILPYRPPLRTPRPRIAGVVSATVQPGPDGTLGGPAQLDEHGRYFVRLHFEPGGEGQASRPMRMAQPFVGSAEGMHFPLRPGVEVLLAFVNGDPDRPLIVGAVPNAQTPSTVTAHNSQLNRIQTQTGVLIEFGRPS